MLLDLKSHRYGARKERLKPGMITPVILALGKWGWSNRDSKALLAT